MEAKRTKMEACLCSFTWKKKLKTKMVQGFKVFICPVCGYHNWSYEEK